MNTYKTANCDNMVSKCYKTYVAWKNICAEITEQRIEKKKKLARTGLGQGTVLQNDNSRLTGSRTPRTSRALRDGCWVTKAQGKGREHGSRRAWRAHRAPILQSLTIRGLIRILSFNLGLF